jgi:hypothetical protein
VSGPTPAPAQEPHPQETRAPHIVKDAKEAAAVATRLSSETPAEDRGDDPLTDTRKKR